MVNKAEVTAFSDCLPWSEASVSLNLEYMLQGLMLFYSARPQETQTAHSVPDTRVGTAV
jgi:hypothetical protein